MVIQSDSIALPLDPKKWAPVFRGDHAQTKDYSAMAIQSDPIAL
jgi:hypothetical protein